MASTPLSAGLALMCQISPAWCRSTVLLMMLFSSSKSMTWTYRHKGRAGQKLTDFPLTFTDHRDWQENRAHPRHHCQLRSVLKAFTSTHASDSMPLKTQVWNPCQGLSLGAEDPAPATPSPPNETRKALPPPRMGHSQATTGVRARASKKGQPAVTVPGLWLG